MRKLPIYFSCVIFLFILGFVVFNHPIHNDNSVLPASVSSVPTIPPKEISLSENCAYSVTNTSVSNAQDSSTSEINDSTEPEASVAKEPAALPHEPEAPDQSGTRPKRNILKIHVTDTEGNPVSELPVRIDSDGINNFAGFTDENGDAFWKSARSGKWKVVIDEYAKVFKKQEYMIEVTDQLTPVELTWNYENPGLLPLPIYSTVSIQFLDQDGLPARDLNVSVGIVWEAELGNTEMALLLGPTDEEGMVFWDNPAIGTHQMHAFLKKADDSSETFKFDLRITDEEVQELTFILKDPVKE